ncbi:glycosyltransferase family 61 protein [Pimelobacter simplex]|uniref:glycosyltransferase family 61 protein n=1 Tax=Nocardioides simplex TaxID=2045 RepID=UPI003AAA4BCC
MLRRIRNARTPRPAPADELLDGEVARHLAAAGGRVVVIDEDLAAPQAEDELFLALATGERCGVVVVDVPGRDWPVLLARLLLHVAPGGAVVFRGRAERRTEPLVKRLRTLDAVRSGERAPQAEGRKGEDVRALAAAIGGWHEAGTHVVVTSAVRALAKLREAEVDRLLAEGRLRGEVLATVPAVRFTARCTVAQTESAVRHAEVREIEAPAMALRAYDDVVCAPRQVVVQDGVLLPDTFRRSHRRRLRSAALTDLAPRFAALRTPAEDAEPLSGTWVHLDSEYPGHFGHLLTEQLSRMWAWPRILEEVPRPRVLLSTRTPRTAPYAFERDVLAAFGVAESDIRVIDRPVRVERLLSATPMLAQPGWVHPGIDQAWLRAGAALAAGAEERERPRRIFCARRTDKRACRNAAEVEALFAAEGFAIVYPEEHPLAEQAAMFRAADVVGGYAGAAMFNLCWTDGPKDVVLLVPESYTAENEYLMAAVQGHRLSLVWCPSDVALPEEGFSAEAYQASYVADLVKDGDWLRSRLRAAR